MIKGTGDLHGTGGHVGHGDVWPVTYRIDIDDQGMVAGTIEFAPGTLLQTYNAAHPVYLHLSDGRWALVYLPPEREDETVYTIGPNSRIIDRPEWAGSKGGA